MAAVDLTEAEVAGDGCEMGVEAKETKADKINPLEKPGDSNKFPGELKRPAETQTRWPGKGTFNNGCQCVVQ